MDQNEDTKSGPVQKQPGAELDVPDVLQLHQESPRKCKICGGPNHQGCGCEAKQRRTVDMPDIEPISPWPAEPTGPQPAEPKPAETALTKEELEALNRLDKSFCHIEAMSDNLSDLCGNVHTVISYLSNIDQHLKEIHAMVKARIRQDGKSNQD